ncbi:MAG: GIY-YIG nuclease family protein [Woeseiaceae bacterium]
MARRKHSYNIYVIDLDKDVLNSKKFRDENPDYIDDYPCVYVGQTAKSPDERFDQHKAGIKSNSYAKKYGLRLRYKLFEEYNPIATRKEAEYKEALLGEHLRKRGFAVWWN